MDLGRGAIGRPGPFCSYIGYLVVVGTAAFSVAMMRLERALVK